MVIIPIIILSRNRPDQLRDMVDSIEARTEPGTYKIIICDNDSQCLKTKKLLHDLGSKHVVIRNKSNNGFEGFNDGLKEVDTDFFVLSDPDIKLNNNMPLDWPKIMIKCLNHVNVPKVGLALKIDYPESKIQKRVFACESNHWKELYKFPFIEDQCYLAPLDTTFSMYRRDTFLYWKPEETLCFKKNKGLVGPGYISQDYYNRKYYAFDGKIVSGAHVCIRMGGRFEAEHLGWNFEGKYTDEIKEYSSTSNIYLASTAKWMKDNGII